ncbi:MAG: hypothetical protein MUC44_05305 [Beijerinckiaceae bacterium]|nr:hypothetical protein [Beijerinckiaceae bacterium]
MSARQASRFPAARRSASGRGLLAAILALAVLVLVLPAIPRLNEDELSIPLGYHARVKGLVQLGKLQRREGDDGYEPAADLHCDLNRNRNVPVCRFITASFLAEDLSRDDASLWVEDEERGPAGIDRNAHKEIGPNESIVRWRGDLLFRSLDEVVSEKPGGNGPAVLVVDLQTRATWKLTAGSGAQDCTKLVSLDTQPTGPVAPAAGPVLGCGLAFQSAGGKEVVLRPVGDQAMLFFKGPPPGEVRVDGLPLNMKLALFGERLEPLYRDRLTSKTATAVKSRRLVDLDFIVPMAGREDGTTRHFRVMPHVPMISSRYPTGALVRSADRTIVSTRRYARGLESFARPIEQRLTKGSFQTSLVEELHNAGQQALTAVARQVLAQPGKAPVATFLASATLMDGLTGEIVGLPTWPAEAADLDPRLGQLAIAPRLYQDNNNFVQQAVGSTAKVPFAAAIITQNPKLSRLKLESKEAEFGCFMGWNKSALTKEKALTNGNPMGMSEFIARSSNRYALSLMLLSLERPEGGKIPLCNGEPDYFFDGTRMNTRRSIGIWDNRNSRDTWTALQVPWSETLIDMFCINSQDGAAVDQKPGCTRDLWGNSKVTGGSQRDDGPADRRALAGVHKLLPVSLGFNQIKDLYSDYLMSIIGGNRSRWTTIQLAQAYARVISWQKIEPRLVPADPQMPPPGGLPTVSTSDDVRKKLQDGMKAVLDDGTAKALRATPEFRRLADAPEDESGTRLVFFGKTGTTQTFGSRPPTAQALALRQYWGDGCGLRAEQSADGYRLTRVAGEASVKCRAVTTPTSLALIDREIAELNAYRLLPELEVEPEGRIVAGLPLRTAVGKGGINSAELEGKAFVLVAARYRKGDTGQKSPCAVSVIASNFGSGRDTSPALVFTRMLLKDEAVRQWLLRVPASCNSKVSA